MPTENISIYIHYPFCKSKCPYCDFNSHVSDYVNYDYFIESYKKELNSFKENIGNKNVVSIYFGGGTPSLMPIDLVKNILAHISKLFNIKTDCEITLESNPTSFEAKKFLEFKKIGINRISIGIQALNDNDLKFLGRQHSANDSIKTIEKAANIFTNFSFDLIYSRPNQSIKNWEEELKFAIKFNSNHMSLYQLTIEKGTQFYKDFINKKFTLPNEDLSCEMFEVTNEIMKNSGYNQYEISNYSKKNFESIHNNCYWKGYDYIGIGPGAHSRIYFLNDKYRKEIIMTYDPKNWINSIKNKGNAIQKISNISKTDLLKELLLMGLRLEDGLNSEMVKIHFKNKLNKMINFDKLKKLIDNNFLEVSENNIKITRNGRNLTNSIISYICECLNFDKID